jgi:hypothetical protein
MGTRLRVPRTSKKSNGTCCTLLDISGSETLAIEGIAAGKLNSMD